MPKKKKIVTDVVTRLRQATCEKCERISLVLDGGPVSGFSLPGCDHFIKVMSFIYKQGGKDILKYRKDMKDLTKPVRGAKITGLAKVRVKP